MKRFLSITGSALAGLAIGIAAAFLTLAQLSIALPRAVFQLELPQWLQVRHGYAWSFQITENFVNQYEANFYVLAQQMASRFEASVDTVSGIIGQSKSVERVGKADAYDIVSRHADTQYVQTPHSQIGRAHV